MAAALIWQPLLAKSNFWLFGLAAILGGIHFWIAATLGWQPLSAWGNFWLAGDYKEMFSVGNFFTSIYLNKNASIIYLFFKKKYR